MPLRYSPECCASEEYNADCLYDDVCEYYNRIKERHRRLVTKRKRIHEIAYPKHVTPKFQKSCPCNSTRKTSIIREMPCITRTEQLSYPYARRLFVLQTDCRGLFGPDRMNVLNRTIRKSVLSMYSRLASYTPPKRRKRVPCWGKKKWAIHTKHFTRLARPKKKFLPQKKVHIWKELSLMKRYKSLAKPKKRAEIPIPKWELTPELKKYKATERILNLCKPKERDENVHYQPLPTRVTPEAKAYKATPRIKELATAPEVRLGESDLKENPFGISPNALKAKASERIVELSVPKEYEDNHTRENPFAISPAALKAKATPRTLELAKAKGT